jgi:hypothetical protein
MGPPLLSVHGSCIITFPSAVRPLHRSNAAAAVVSPCRVSQDYFALLVRRSRCTRFPLLSAPHEAWNRRHGIEGINPSLQVGYLNNVVASCLLRRERTVADCFPQGEWLDACEARCINDIECERLDGNGDGWRCWRDHG